MLTSFLHHLASASLELAPWLLLGATVAGLLHGLLPADFAQRRLRGLRGVLAAVLVGVPMPLCSCGVIPTGIGLRRQGASTGASLGFLIATPQTGVDSILVSAGFLGWPFALMKVAAALVTGLVGGSIAEAVVKEAPVAEGAASCAVKDRSPRAMAAVSVDLVRMIWRWLVFGLLLSAGLNTLLPAQGLPLLRELDPLLASLGVLLAAIPLYVCATASVPVAASLAAGGLPTPAVMVFLMAGPAVSLASLAAVRKGLGPRALAVYIATISLGSLGFGLLYDAFLPPLPDMRAAHLHEHLSPASVLAAVVLGGLFLRFAWEDLGSLRRRLSRARGPQMQEMQVAGMTCGGCARKLERHLLDLPGVEGVEVSLAEGRVRVTGRVPLGQLEETVRAAGFLPRAAA